MSDETPSSQLTECPFCESEISASAKKCRHCGEWVSRDCLVCGTPIRREWAAEGRCAGCQGKVTVTADATPVPAARHSRGIAGLLALLLGGVGGHKFYLGKPLQGILYALFCWTLLPSFVGMIEGIVYLASSDESFWAKYG